MHREELVEYRKVEKVNVVHADNDVRYVPKGGYANSFCGIAHESRYAWILSNWDLSGKRVLDLGCGSGYGAHSLARRAGIVIGADVSLTAVDYAIQRFKLSNLEFMVLDAADYSIVERLGEKSFDLIISFDVIEHVEKYFDFLSNCSTLIRPDGIVIVGTPNRAETFDRKLQWNPYHFQEFSAYQLRKILGLYFRDVRLVAQSIADPAKREALRSGPKSGSANRKGHRSLIKRFGRAITRRVVGRVLRRQHLSRRLMILRTPELAFSDIVFDTREDDEVLRSCFGLIAICLKPIFPQSKQ